MSQSVDHWPNSLGPHFVTSWSMAFIFYIIDCNVAKCCFFPQQHTVACGWRSTDRFIATHMTWSNAYCMVGETSHTVHCDVPYQQCKLDVTVTSDLPRVHKIKHFRCEVMFFLFESRWVSSDDLWQLIKHILPFGVGELPSSKLNLWRGTTLVLSWHLTISLQQATAFSSLACGYSCFAAAREMAVAAG